jgi:hypothetical protein
MRARRVAVLALAVVGLVLTQLPTEGWAQSPEQWRCTLDLHQGDIGILELSRTGTSVAGVMIIATGKRRVEYTISGQWNGDVIGFSRVLTATSHQPFRGTVSASGDNGVTMSGQFAAGFAGNWSAACERTQAATPQDAAAPKLRRRKPIPTTTDRDARIVTQVGPLITTFGETPGVLLNLLAKAPAAKWSDSSSILKFPGDPANPRGFARYLESSVLEDGQGHGRVLETHPATHRRAIIVGRYAGVTIPQAGAELQAGIGFAKDAVVPGGIYFEVRGEFDAYHGLRLRREYLKPRDGRLISDFTQDLSRFRGLTGRWAPAIPRSPEQCGSNRGWRQSKAVRASPASSVARSAVAATATSCRTPGASSSTAMSHWCWRSPTSIVRTRCRSSRTSATSASARPPCPRSSPVRPSYGQRSAAPKRAHGGSA